MPKFNWAYIFPFHRFAFSTSLAPGDVVHRLSIACDPGPPTPDQWGAPAPETWPFAGRAFKDGFRLLAPAPPVSSLVWAVDYGGRIYRPWLIGTLTPDPSKGTRVAVTARLSALQSMATPALLLSMEWFPAGRGERLIEVGIVLGVHLLLCGIVFAPLAKLAERRLRQLLPGI